jgi:hypothetical protein
MAGSRRWFGRLTWLTAGYVGLVACLLWLCCACASPTPSREGAAAGRATATRAGEGLTPEASRPARATLSAATLAPVATVVKEEMEMKPTDRVSPGLQRLVEQALADLAERLGLGAEQIEVLEAKAVVWPDGGLGCPQPGVAYTQVQVEGVLIRLRVGKRVYPYHGGGGRAPFLCEQPMPDQNFTPPPGLGDQ